MHQLDNLSNLLHDYWGERTREARANRSNLATDIDSIAVPVIVTLAVGGLGLFLFKILGTQK